MFSGSCGAGVCHRSSHGAIEEDYPGLQCSAPGSVQQGGFNRRPHRRLHCPERCAKEGHVQSPGTSQQQRYEQAGVYSLGTGARHCPVHQNTSQAPVSRPLQRKDLPQLQPRHQGIHHSHPARPSLLGPVPSGFIPYRQHHWPAHWISSRQWQIASTPQQRVADLYQSAYSDGLAAPLDRHGPRLPLVYQPPAPHDLHCVPRGLLPSRDTSLINPQKPTGSPVTQQVRDLCTDWLCLYFLFYLARPNVPSVGHKRSDHSGNIVCTLAFSSLGKQTKAKMFLFSVSL